MKKLISLIFVCLFFWGYAQKFQITDSKGTPYNDGETISVAITEDDLNDDEEFIQAFEVKNLTESDLEVVSLRTNLELPDGMMAWVCYGVCFEDNVFQISWGISGNEKEDYALHLFPNELSGLCKFKIDFWSDEEQTDLFTLNVEITVGEVGIKENNNSSVSLNAYPNPVSVNSTLNITYHIPDGDMGNNLVIRNIFGAKVMSTPLNPYDNKITIETASLPSGVYFYAVENRNAISAAKKLIVK